MEDGRWRIVGREIEGGGLWDGRWKVEDCGMEDGRWRIVGREMEGGGLWDGRWRIMGWKMEDCGREMEDGGLWDGGISPSNQSSSNIGPFQLNAVCDFLAKFQFATGN